MYAKYIIVFYLHSLIHFNSEILIAGSIGREVFTIQFWVTCIV